MSQGRHHASWRLYTVVLVGALSLSACADQASTPQTVQIAATPWALQWLAEAVAPQASVHSIGVLGQDPHDSDLGPKDRETLERADILVYLGPIGFQPQVEAVAASRQGPVVALSTDDAAARADTHLWFEPERLAAAAIELGAQLAKLQPAQAETHRARAANVAAQLRELPQDLDRMLSNCQRSTVVVSHAAFARLLQPRGLTQVGIAGPQGHAEASPARLAELTELIRKQALSAVLAERSEGRAAAEALAREAGVPVRDIDSLESPALADRELGYPALLRQQARMFADTMECNA